MSTKANKQVICDVLMEEAAGNEDIVVLCSDSRGSASLAEYAKSFPLQFVETGIAEQNLVSIAAGLARAGKRPFAASPACFLSTRSMEQAKVDVAYSGTNVKLVGISGGVSYGTLGLTHHSTNDIAVFASTPYMRVYLPSDQYQTRALMQQLVKDNEPAYIRVGRAAVEDVYEDGTISFKMNKATVVREGKDVAIIACGETVKPAKDAAAILAEQGVNALVLDMYCLKPIDIEAVLKAAKCGAIVTVEEHVPQGGLTSMVAEITASEMPVKVKGITLPDSAVISGTSREVFEYYGLTAQNIAKTAKGLI